MTYEEAIERLENLKVKAEVALSNSNTSCEWLKEDVEGTIIAFDMAIEALEKQIPKKPRVINLEGKCGSCKYATPTRFSEKGGLTWISCGYPKVWSTPVAHLKQRTAKCCKKYERSEVE